MARKLRVEYAGACYHVINRGNYRRDLFGGKGAAESFEKCLFEVCERFGWRLHGYVIMRNHFHLAIETPEPNLSDGMRWLQCTWAVRFNRFRGEAGRPFQGRYKALHVEPGHSLAQVVHYIHLNPVRAKVVTAERVGDYRWSSLVQFPKKDRPDFFEAATVLRESGGLADSASGWRNYLGYLGVLAEEEDGLRGKKYGRLSRGWVVGSEEFRAEMLEELKGKAGDNEDFELLGADAEAHRQLREAIWEKKLKAGAKALGLKLDQLPLRKSAREKVLLASALRACSSVSNTWLAERLQMGPAASVSQYVRRFHLDGKETSREFRTLLSRVNP